MIKDIIKKINKFHKYSVTNSYWGRIGSMYKRYGEETLSEAVETTQPQNIPLDNMLNIIERKCQYILENGKDSIDELTNDFLNIEGNNE